MKAKDGEYHELKAEALSLARQAEAADLRPWRASRSVCRRETGGR